jgi:hypothetical protein
MLSLQVCRNPTLKECEDETHTPEMRTRKLLKCKCQKWPRMSHLDICSTNYGQKKGRESNWQFDSRH